MVLWEWVAIGYASYLAAVAVLLPRFRRARLAAIGAASAAWLLLPFLPPVIAGLPAVVRALMPAPILLAGYWLSGRFILQPMPRLEGLLVRIDGWMLRAVGMTAYRRQRWLGRYLELAYLLVYAVVPAGAMALLAAGHEAAIDRFWATVLLAAFVSYGMLPWMQTRPPRILEGSCGTPSGETDLVRRTNLWLLRLGSIHANTIPSGHAATATAVALSVGAAIPESRAIVAIAGASIVVATIAGRYHFVVDSVLGVLVGLLAWSVV